MDVPCLWTWVRVQGRLCRTDYRLLLFVLLTGGDRDEGEDSVGDLRRTESDSVLKKVDAGSCLLELPLPHSSVAPPTGTKTLACI